ncbi:MAG: hypothetical protein EPN37_07860 [Chitinophagaceae bacterium]|nr:MAG: hypothetical protein EPN37_07860 [Chitinophagaceae bacterium]
MKKHIDQILFRVGILSLLLLGSLLVASAQSPILVVNQGYKLLMNADDGAIQSFETTLGGGDTKMLIPGQGKLPLFKVELRNSDGKFIDINSSQAKKVTITKSGYEGGEDILIHFEDISNLRLNADVTVRCPSNEPLTYWSLKLDNPTKMWIAHIQFPLVEVPFDRNPTEDDGSHILYSLYDGVLVGPVEPGMVCGAWRSTRYDTPETWRSPNYPRDCTTQMMAYYNASGGLFVACEDSTGMPKLIAPLMERDGVMMGVGHYPGTQGPGETSLPYKVVIGAFRGDWYAAAAMYRSWADKQSYLPAKLIDRTDYPQWLLKPVVGVAFPMRGEGDWDPPAAVNTEYTPATHALPYLDKLSSAFNASLMPIVFNWEHSGPWVQPQAFPPLGGEDNMKLFMKKARAKGWHPALYGDGVNWVVAQKNTGYNGMAYFKSHGGDSAIVHSWWGVGGPSNGWRSLYNTCIATQAARRMILGMTRGMAELGPSVIQQFDQGVGAVACYATDHGHPPVPGPWMTKDFASLLEEDNAVARTADPGVAISGEGAPPEVYLKYFDLWDARTGGGGYMMVPLYSFIYHQYLNGHAGFYTNSVNSEALRDAVARALVSGYMLNFTLRDSGRIEYDWDQLWTRAMPDQPSTLDWARRSTRFRYGIARDFLIYGKMLPPWNVTHVTKLDFGLGKEPLVQSATWKAPDGRIGIVLANYGNVEQIPQVELEGHGMKKVLLYVDGKTRDLKLNLPSVLNVDMPSRSLGLVEISSSDN